MIVISSDGKSGVSPLFPALSRKNRKAIWVFDWSKYGRDVYFYALINISFSTISLLLLLRPELSAEPLINALSLLLLMYIFFRFVVRRGSVKIDLKRECSLRVAPMIVWFDFFGFGLMFFLSAAVQDRMDGDPVSHVINLLVRLIFCVVAMLPLMNYAVFLFSNKDKS